MKKPQYSANNDKELNVLLRRRVVNRIERNVVHIYFYDAYKILFYLKLLSRFVILNILIV